MVSFTTTTTVLAASAMLIQSASAGGLFSAIFGKRSLETRTNHLWTRQSTLQQSFDTCFQDNREQIKITQEGTASFKIEAADGSFPEACIEVAKSYQSTSQFDGQLITNGDGTYTLHPNAKDVPALKNITEKKGEL